MKNKLFLVIILVVSTVFGCTSNPNDSLAEKEILQQLDVDGMGMIHDFEIQELVLVNDSVYEATHTFTNTLYGNRKVRVTRNYYFTQSLDSIKYREDLKSEMLSDGEWVQAGF